MKRLLPNLITSLRIMVIPLVIFAIRSRHFRKALSWTALGAGSDFLDGFTARKLGLESSSGALFDPVADKLFETMLMRELARRKMLPAPYVWLVTFRNLAQLSCIPILSWLRISYKVKPRFPARLATALGMGSIFFTLGIQTLKPGPVRFMVQQIRRWVVIPLSCLLELQVLWTFFPRFRQIIRGEHDTFI